MCHQSIGSNRHALNGWGCVYDFSVGEVFVPLLAQLLLSIDRLYLTPSSIQTNGCICYPNLLEETKLFPGH